MPYITLSVTTTPGILTISGTKSIGAAADIVATAIPGTGSPIPLGTMLAQPDGPYVMSATVPAGNYTVQVATGTTVSSDTRSTSTVLGAMLTVSGSNTLGLPACINVTATPTGGGSTITIANLVNQPVGPYSVAAEVPPGQYQCTYRDEGGVTLRHDGIFHRCRSDTHRKWQQYPGIPRRYQRDCHSLRRRQSHHDRSTV